MLTKPWFTQEIQKLTTAKTLWIACSGGLDSTVLLHLAVQTFQELSAYVIKVIHIAEGHLHNSPAVIAHIQSLCMLYNIDFKIIPALLNTDKTVSPEEAERNARLRALQAHIPNDEVILFAHHARDQVETCLMRLFRGSGIQGMQGMRKRQVIGSITVLRPLLDITYGTMQEYAKTYELQWYDDSSNLDQVFDRNYMRHTILPNIINRWPQALSSIHAFAKLCQEEQQWLDEIIEALFLTVYDKADNTLCVSKLLALPDYKCKAVIRYWLSQASLQMPNKNHLAIIISEVLQAKMDAVPRVKIANYEIRRYQDKLYVYPQSVMLDLKKLPREYYWEQWEEKLVLGAWVLQTVLTTGKGIAKHWLDNKAITIRFRQGGEKCQPAGRRHSHSLKKLLQEANIPPWFRDTIPLIYIDNHLVAVVGLWVCDPFLAKKDEMGIEIKIT